MNAPETAPERCARFVLRELQHRSPRHWRGARRAGPLRPLESMPEWSHPLAVHSLYRVPLGAQKALLGMLFDQWPLVVMERVPTPREVLAFQARGQRPVTLIEDEAMRDTVVYDGKAPLEFLLHDLSHAECYFGRPEWHPGQLMFYRWCLGAWEQNAFGDAFARDPLFKEQMEYAISDMNAHALHLLKYVKGIWIEHALRVHGQTRHDLLSPAAFAYLHQLIEVFAAGAGLDAATVQALKDLNSKNHPAADAAMAHLLSLIPPTKDPHALDT